MLPLLTPRPLARPNSGVHLAKKLNMKRSDHQSSGVDRIGMVASKLNVELKPQRQSSSGTKLGRPEILA